MIRRTSSIAHTIRVVLLVLCIGLLSACGQGGSGNPGEYQDDGYLGMTQTNPNLPTSPTARSHYEDTQIARRTLMGIDGIKQVQMFSNGPHVFVNIRLEEGLTDQQRERIRMDAEKALSYQNPRFDYQVRLHND